MEEQKHKKCFIITPIGDDSSEIRRKADGVIESVIKPALSEIGFDEIYAAHQISLSGSINKQVINAIVNDDLVVANLTGLNPNVMYELAIRHVTKKPIVHIAEAGTRLPFDIIDQRTVFYNDDMFGVKELKVSFLKAVEACSNKENKDNPIYNAIEDKIMREQLSTEPNNEIINYMLNRLDGLENKVESSKSKKLPKDSGLRGLFLSNHFYAYYELGLRVDEEFQLVDFINLININLGEDFSIDKYEIEKRLEVDGKMEIRLKVRISYDNRIITQSILEKALYSIEFTNFEVFSVKESKDSLTNLFMS